MWSPRCHVMWHPTWQVGWGVVGWVRSGPMLPLKMLDVLFLMSPKMCPMWRIKWASKRWHHGLQKVVSWLAWALTWACLKLVLIWIESTQGTGGLLSWVGSWIGLCLQGFGGLHSKVLINPKYTILAKKNIKRISWKIFFFLLMSHQFSRDGKELDSIE